MEHLLQKIKASLIIVSMLTTGAWMPMHAITNPFKTDVSKVGFKNKQDAMTSLTTAYKTAFGSVYFQKPNGSLFKQPALLADTVESSGTKIKAVQDHIYNNAPGWWQFEHKLELYVNANAQDLLNRPDNTIVSFYQSISTEIMNTIMPLLYVRNTIANIQRTPQQGGTIVTIAMKQIPALNANIERLQNMAINQTILQLKKEKDTLKRKTEVIDVLLKVIDFMITANKSAITQLNALNTSQPTSALITNSSDRSTLNANINQFYALLEEKTGSSMPPEERWANAEVWLRQLKELSTKIKAVSATVGKVTEQKLNEVAQEYYQSDAYKNARLFAGWDETPHAR